MRKYMYMFLEQKVQKKEFFSSRTSVPLELRVLDG